ncbi:ComEA family DNA-binding protein [Paenibacillus koleovorans]|uniref:ComEA family DNA-binding protein n=1 Tax=Paenibacillus koleovorans TaxID=121608 RepID=UPI000FD8D28C|nr:helix-hairpin-helix domain-containing protein [Paenibacillus koleovorans]
MKRVWKSRSGIVFVWLAAGAAIVLYLAQPWRDPVQSNGLVVRNEAMAALFQDGDEAPTSPRAAASTPRASASPVPAQPARKINLNRATVSQLDRLPGIGPAKAEAIVAYRTQIGSYQRVEQLLEVKGIGPKLYAALLPVVTLEE